MDQDEDDFKQIEPVVHKKVKRTNSSASDNQVILFTMKSKTDQQSELSHQEKKIKLIKFEDPIILKLIQKQQFQWLEKMCLDVGIKLKLKIDKFNSYVELTQCIGSQGKDSLQDIEIAICEIKADIQKNIVQERIPCSIEEYKCYKKLITQQNPELLELIDSKFIQSFGNNQVKLDEDDDGSQEQSVNAVNHYIINGRFIIKLVKFDNPGIAALSKFDAFIINTDKNGIFTDQLGYEIAQGHKNLKHRIKEASENGMLKEGLFTGLSFTEGKNMQKQIQLCVNVVENLDKMKENMTTLINKLEVMEITQESFACIGLVVPQLKDLDTFYQIFLKHFIDKGDDDSLLQFPSEINFIVNSKQLSLTQQYFNQVKDCKTIYPKKKKKGGYWVYKPQQPQQQAAFGLGFNYNYNAQNLNQEEKLSDFNSFYLDLAISKNKKSVKLCLPPKPPVVQPNPYNAYPYYARKRKNNQIQQEEEDPVEKIQINFEAMVEELKQSNIFRPILKTDDQKLQFQDTISQQFKSYEPELTEAFQDMLTVGLKQYEYERSLLDNSLKSRVMKVNFKKYTLRDLETNEIYEINRVEDETMVYNMQDQEKDFEGIIYLQETDNKEIEEQKLGVSDEAQQQKENLKQIPYAQIRGCKEFLNSAITILDEIKMKKYVQHTIFLENELKQDNYNQIQELLKQNNIEVERKNNAVILKGYAKTINRVRNEVIKISEIETQSLSFPREWQPQQENCKLFDVDKGSDEGKMVIKRCRQSVQQINIVKIQRIQNKNLWKNYCFEKQKMEQKGNAKEKMLFHGTRQTDPSLIFQGMDEGFDFRMAAPGLYGTGIYFAETAAYSVNFAHPLKNGNSNLFLAKVLVGNIYISQPQQLRVPPYLPGKKNARYDSVRGANNSPEHIIYNNNKAYPYYLIEFKANNGNLNAFGAFNYNAPQYSSQDEDDSNQYNEEFEEM